MLKIISLCLAAAPVQAAFRASLPAPSLPTALVSMPVGAPALAPRMTAPSSLPGVPGLAVSASLPAARVPAVVLPAAAAAPAAVAGPANGAAAPLPAAAEAARPAVQGKAAWAGLFDGRAPAAAGAASPAANAVDPSPFDAESALRSRRADESDFWAELTGAASRKGPSRSPLVGLEAVAFQSYLLGVGNSAAVGPRAIRSTLDTRAAELARVRAGVERRAAGVSAEARQTALIEAASRWQRLLRKPLDAKRALDLAGEVRNHREAYLSQVEPGLPGYARAAADLAGLETALAALNASEARAMVERFREDIIHRRSLRVSILLRQKRTGGTDRPSTRFALPGTTLGTMLKRIGGRPQRPEVRVNGGDWTAWGKLNLRGKLADNTLIEILLPD